MATSLTENHTIVHCTFVELSYQVLFVIMSRMRRIGIFNEAMIGALESTGILPVVSIPTLESAVPLARALVEGGARALEVTLRTPCALEGVRSIRAAFPDLFVGVGTVLEEEQARAARDAGARFLVAPGLDLDIVRVAEELDLPFVPGVTNPTDITRAVKLGVTTLKFFPAEISGGVAALTLYHGPFPDVRFIPTGGMTRENIGSYLRKTFVLACGGSYMAPSKEVRAGDWTAITENCRACVAVAQAARREEWT